MSASTIEPINSIKMDTGVIPQFAAPTAIEAIARPNRWLHREIGTAVHVASATFDPITFYWHLPIELAYGMTGPLGFVGDVYLHAATGDFAGSPNPGEIRERAEALAASRGIE
ncbi:MAG: hypothetical protein ACREEM_42490 [Blastocatellia bacterium]